VKNLALFNGNKKYLLLGLKVAFLLVLFCAIYSQMARKDLPLLWQSFQTNWATSPRWPLLIAVLLMPLNVSLEAVKWKVLLKGIHDIRFSSSFAAVLAGITVGMFTPNRVGETAGRAALLPEGRRMIGLGVGFVSSHSQLVASFAIGSFGALLFIYLNGDEQWLLSASLAGGFLSLLLLFSFFRLRFLKALIDRIPLKQIRKYGDSIKPAFDFGIQKLWSALFISGSRHWVFSLQMLLLLLFFDGNAPVVLAFAVVLTAFFLQTLIPSVALLELGVRGAVMIWLCQLTGINELGALAATLALWCINLLFPAICGTLFLWKNIKTEETR